MYITAWVLAWYIGVQVVLGITDQPGEALMGLVALSALFSLVQFSLVIAGIDRHKSDER